VVGVVGWWCTTLLDLTLTVVEQRRKITLTMPKARLIQSAGILLILGGVCLAIAAISQLQPGSHYAFYGVYRLAIFFLTPAFLLLGIGNIGVALRYGEGTGLLGRLALSVAGIGALMLAAATLLLTIRDSFWTFVMVGLVVHTSGVLIFGLIHVRAPVLPVFRGLPLVMGLLLLMPMFFQGGDTYGANLGQFTQIVGIGVGWVLTGVAIHKHQRRLVPAAESVPGFYY
jgi:hypothetical protein